MEGKRMMVDDSSFKKGMQVFRSRANIAINSAVSKIADEVLRLSEIEIPMDEGYRGGLASTGAIENGPDKFEYIVGYNKVYAARLHEHPEYRFRRDKNPNAKGKYLEDPIKVNLSVFNKFAQDTFSNSIG